jgi:hypothetical protein
MVVLEAAPLAVAAAAAARPIFSQTAATVAALVTPPCLAVAEIRQVLGAVTTIPQALAATAAAVFWLQEE